MYVEGRCFTGEGENVRGSAATAEETRTGGLGIRCEGVVHLYKTFGGHDVVACGAWA